MKCKNDCYGHSIYSLWVDAGSMWKRTSAFASGYGYSCSSESTASVGAESMGTSDSAKTDSRAGHRIRRIVQ